MMRNGSHQERGDGKMKRNLRTSEMETLSSAIEDLLVMTDLPECFEDARNLGEATRDVVRMISSGDCFNQMDHFKAEVIWMRACREDRLEAARKAIDAHYKSWNR
jgi:acyl-homoserine lactone acylase PvdQ